MSNDPLYAGGLLSAALDPSTQPSAIRAFLREESELVQSLIADGMRVLDIGCGTGRHLSLLASRLSLGIGVDNQLRYIADAVTRRVPGSLEFVVADGTLPPIVATFDRALCLTNTWGTMTDQRGVLDEMRRLSPQPGSRLLCVFSRSSVPARCEWYTRLGHEVVEVGEEFVRTDAGFRSEHFSEARLRSLIGYCELRSVAGIGYLVLA